MLANGFYNTIGAIIRLLLAILTLPLLIRAIGLEEYGLWTLISAAVGLVALAEAGLSISTTVFLSRDLAGADADDISQTLTVSILLMLLLATAAAVLLWLGAEILADSFPGLSATQRAVAAQAFRIGGLVVWARLLQQVLVAIEQAYERYGVLNIVSTIQAAFGSVGLLTVAWLGGRTLEMMQWQLLTSLVILMVHAVIGWILLRRLNLRLRLNGAKGLAMVRYSLLTWAGSLGGALFGQCDRLVVGGLLGTGILGAYAAITNVTVQINGLSGVAVQPMLPLLSNLIAKGNINRPALRGQVKQAVHLNALIALGMGGAFMVLTPAILRILLPGDISHEYELAFRIATVIYALYSLNAVGYYILFSINAVKAFMLIQISSGILSLLMIAAGARFLGLLGASAGNAGYLGVCLLMLYGMKRIQIAARVWVIWLAFPLTWFAVVVAVSLLIPNELAWEILATVLLGGVLLSWFIITERPAFQRLSRMVSTR